MNTSFSIVICCYNSSTRLEATLTHLARLSYPTELVEILLVDNASTDGTTAFAQKIWDNLHAPFAIYYLHERQAGLIHARKKGVEKSNNDFILFVDDDNWVSINYLKVADRLLQSNNHIGVLGGKISGVFETPLPSWMSQPKPFKSLTGSLAISTNIQRYGNLKKISEYVFGAGSFYDKEMLSRFFDIGIVPLLSGRSGNILTSGDDNELCMMARMAGRSIYRSDELHLQHFITSNRLNWEYLHRLYYGFGYSDWILQFYEQIMKGKTFPNFEKQELAQQIRKKERAYRQYARMLKLIPFSESFKKNKLFLLETYQKGRLKFLEEEFENFETIWNKIEDYQEKLR